MENRRNYYRILHVQPGAPVEIIRASYRTLMQRLRAHPDLGGDHWNAALINEAYAVLTDAAKRAEYDREVQARVLDARAGATADAPQATTEIVERCLFCQAVHHSRPHLHAHTTCHACGSPLRRATLKRLAADGKRAIHRVPKDHRLTLYTAWPQARGITARSRDLSLNGISFVTRELLQPRAIVKVDSDMYRAVVQVTNLRMDDDSPTQGWLVGAEFLSVIFTRARGGFLSTQA